MKTDIESIAIKATEKVLDDLLYKGKTLREWIDLIIKFEKEYEILPMGKYPASISGCNMEEDKPKDERFICNTCRKKFGCVYYAAVKDFLEEDPNNNMKCERYIKE